MHIPSGASQTVELLSFETALALSGQGDQYDRTRWLYVPDFYTEYRYILGTRGENPLICIGINPSTAEPDNLDNTLKSVQRIAAGNGFDSFIMFNVYAQRATRPDDMDRALNAQLHRANMAAFRYVLSTGGRGPSPRRLGGLGHHHRKAALSAGLRAGYGLGGGGVRRALGVRGQMLQGGTPPSSALSAKRRAGAGL